MKLNACTFSDRILQNVPMDQRLLSYRQLHLFAAYFEGTYGFMLGFTRNYCLVICVILVFGCVRFFHTLDLRLYLNMPITLLTTGVFAYVFYNPLSKHPGISKKAIRIRFGGSTVRDLGKLERIQAAVCGRSCRTICLRGTKRTMVVGMLKFVVFQACRLLVLIGGK